MINSRNAYDMGLALQTAGKLDAALACFRKVLLIDSAHWESHFRCGVIEQDRGNDEAAMSHYRRVIEIDPEVAEAHNNLGCLLRRLKNYPAAVACFKTAVGLLPDFIEAWNNLSEAHQKDADWESAVFCIDKIRELKPENPEIHIRIGDVFLKAGNPCEAVACYKKAAELAPDFALTYFKLGICSADEGLYDQAMGHYRKAIELKSDSPEPYINLGNLYAKLDKPAEAAVCYRKAIRLKPGAMEPYYFLGCVLRDIGELPQSLVATQKALIMDPSCAEARFSLALSLLLSGNYEKGWRAYDARLQLKENHDDYPYLGRLPMWNGKAFPGKTLLVQSEQGFGDILQFVRFLPLVKQLGGRVVFETHNPVIELLRDFPGIDLLLAHTGNPLQFEDFDFYIPLLSLPGRLGTRIDTIPDHVPYLFASEEKKRIWSKRIDGQGFKVGIAWAGNPQYSKDKVRSCRLAAFEGISRIPGVRLYGLQKEVSPNDRLLSDQMGLCLLGESFRNFSDTAAAIHNLDLVISVDTSVAHLAGAMGKPTWILLPINPDFRWLTRRGDSPWYPTVRLYRQERRGDWTAVLEKVGRKLAGFR